MTVYKEVTITQETYDFLLALLKLIDGIGEEGKLVDVDDKALTDAIVELSHNVD